MPLKHSICELTILNIISFVSIVPLVQLIAGAITLIVGTRQVIKGINAEGGIKNYLKSFLIKKKG